MDEVDCKLTQLLCSIFAIGLILMTILYFGENTKVRELTCAPVCNLNNSTYISSKQDFWGNIKECTCLRDGFRLYYAVNTE
jgi:hypothetical protein